MVSTVLLILLRTKQCPIAILNAGGDRTAEIILFLWRADRGYNRWFLSYCQSSTGSLLVFVQYRRALDRCRCGDALLRRKLHVIIRVHPCLLFGTFKLYLSFLLRRRYLRLPLPLILHPLLSLLLIRIVHPDLPPLFFV